MQNRKSTPSLDHICAVLFIGMAIVASMSPWLALLIPAVLALLEYSTYRKFRPNQALKLRWTALGGALGVALYLTLNTYLTLPALPGVTT